MTAAFYFLRRSSTRKTSSATATTTPPPTTLTAGTTATVKVSTAVTKPVFRGGRPLSTRPSGFGEGCLRVVSCPRGMSAGRARAWHRAWGVGRTRRPHAAQVAYRTRLRDCQPSKRGRVVKGGRGSPQDPRRPRSTTNRSACRAAFSMGRPAYCVGTRERRCERKGVPASPAMRVKQGRTEPAPSPGRRFLRERCPCAGRRRVRPSGRRVSDVTVTCSSRRSEAA